LKAGLAGQHQERRLKGVLGVLVVPQHAAADAQDQRAVALQQRGEGVAIPGEGKAPQQIAVRNLSGVAGGELKAKVADEAT
jgi:hypothetical protein